MSREVRRVPLDFDWPLDKVWGGYLMPAELRAHDCPHCVSGNTFAGQWVLTLLDRLTMLATDVADQERGRPLHPWLAQDTYPPSQKSLPTSNPFIVEPIPVRPSKDIIEFLAALLGEPVDEVAKRVWEPFGYGAMAGYQMNQRLIELLELPADWGVCPACAGTATEYDSPEQLEAAQAWEPTEPATGDGWQLWETVSEGSPVSPVFATAEQLAAHLASANAGEAYERSLAFVHDGWAPSMILRGTDITTSDDIATGRKAP